MKNKYKVKLDELRAYCDEVPNTKMMALAKINALITMFISWDKIQVDRNLESSPYLLMQKIIDDTLIQVKAWGNISFIESSDSAIVSDSEVMEEMHQELFQMLWASFNEDEYIDRINRFEYRLKVNDLADGFLKGKRCIDFGCGHGNFDHSFLKAGAASVLGIDYGEDSIKYAENARESLGVDASRLSFKCASVYETGEEDSSYDMALQNGVFHHLEDENKAYQEVHRVLKPGGWFWIYTDGANGIFHDMVDICQHILKEVPSKLIFDQLKALNIETGKRYHIGDSFNAVYRHTTWEELTERLGQLGFNNFRLLIGGYPTDLDYDVIEADTYGVEKFGGGDLRILCQKV